MALEHECGASSQPRCLMSVYSDVSVSTRCALLYVYIYIVLSQNAIAGTVTSSCQQDALDILV